jgi:hypothetical protein
MSISSRRSDGFSPAWVIPLGMKEMGGVLAGRVGRVLGWVLGAVVGLPALVVWGLGKAFPNWPARVKRRPLRTGGNLGP